MDKLHAIAAALLERETITGEEIKRIMDGKELDPFVLDGTKKADENDTFAWSEESKEIRHSETSENAGRAEHAEQAGEHDAGSQKSEDKDM